MNLFFSNLHPKTVRPPAIKWEDGGMQANDWREALCYIGQRRTLDTLLDAVHGGNVADDQWHNAASTIEPYAEAGVIWWLEDVSPWRFGASEGEVWQPEHTRRMVELIRRGPPRL